MDAEHSAHLEADGAAPAGQGDGSGEPDDGPSLSLDPVAVFLHSSEAVAGGIFEGMMDLLQAGRARGDGAAAGGNPEEDGSQREEPAASQSAGTRSRRRQVARERESP